MNHKHPLDNINAIGTLVLVPFFLMASVLWLAQIILAGVAHSAAVVSEWAEAAINVATSPVGGIINEAKRASRIAANQENGHAE